MRNIIVLIVALFVVGTCMFMQTAATDTTPNLITTPVVGEPVTSGPSLQSQLDTAILELFAADLAMPAERTVESVTRYNRRLEAAIREHDRLQLAINGPKWRENMIMDARVSSCGLYGSPRMECLNAPMDISSIKTVENSLLPLPKAEPEQAPNASSYTTAETPSPQEIEVPPEPADNFAAGQRGW